jgi:ATP synthase protein I
MQSSDARILRSAAIPTALAGLVAMVICGALVGSKGLIAAIMALAMVTVFFTISVVAVAYAAKISPQAMMPAALGSYVLKLLVLSVALSAFKNVSVWSPKAFAWSVLALTLVWIVAEARFFLRTKILYVDEPAGSDADAPAERADR